MAVRAGRRYRLLGALLVVGMLIPLALAGAGGGHHAPAQPDATDVGHAEAAAEQAPPDAGARTAETASRQAGVTPATEHLSLGNLAHPASGATVQDGVPAGGPLAPA